MATAPMKVSIGVNIDASGARTGGAAAKTAVAQIGEEATRTATKLQQLINSSVGLHDGAANNNARAWTGALAAEALAADNLRAKYNPLYAAIRQYKQAQVEIRTAHAQGIISENEMAAAISRHRQATLASIDAIKGRNAALEDQPMASGAMAPGGIAAFQTANIAAQFQDIAVTSAMGMSPLQIALQQGTQLSAVLGPMGATGAARGLGAALMSVISPASLLTIGLVGGTAAAIQYFTSASKEAKSLDELLDKHGEAIARVRDLWGEAADQSSRYGRDSTTSASFGLQTNINALTKRLSEGIKDGSIGSTITSAINSNRELAGLSASEFRGTTLFKQLKVDLGELHREALRGSPVVLELIQNLESFGQSTQNSGLRAMAAEAVAALQPFKELAQAIRDAELERRRLFDDRGANGRLLSRGTTNTADAGNLALYESQQRVQMERTRQSFAAEIARLNARSPEEKAAAARQQAASEYRDESPAIRRQRIELAGASALAQAEKELTEAQRNRMRALEQAMSSQQLDLSLIGKTAGEIAAMRKEFELTADLREQSARTGVSIDQNELEIIREKSAEYGRMAEAIARANLANELTFERSQLARGREDRAIASRLQGAGLPVDLNSPEARVIRETMREQQGRAMIGGFFEDLQSGFRNGGKNLGEVFGNAAVDAGYKFASRLMEPLYLLAENALIGSAKGNPGGILATFLGMGGSAKSNAPANDNQTIGGLIGSNVVRMPLPAPDASLYRQAIANIESRGSGGYSALGPVLASGDRAYGAFGVMGANIPSWTKGALGKSLTPQQFLGDPRAQDNVFDHYFGKSVARYGNPQDAASVWFTGRPLSKGANATDVLGTSGSGYVEKFNTELGRLSGAAGKVTGTIGGLGDATSQAAKGLGTLGTGFDKFGQNLSTSFFPSAPGAGAGALGGIFNLFPGLGGFSGSGQLMGAISRGSWGLWSEGGFTGWGAKYEPAGVVHKGEVVWSQRDVARAGGVAVVEAMRRGYGGYADGGAVDVPVTFPTRTNRADAQVVSGPGKLDVAIAVHLVGGDAFRSELLEAAQSAGTEASVQLIDRYDANLPNRVNYITENPRMR